MIFEGGEKCGESGNYCAPVPIDFRKFCVHMRLPILNGFVSTVKIVPKSRR